MAMDEDSVNYVLCEITVEPLNNGHIHQWGQGSYPLLGGCSYLGG